MEQIMTALTDSALQILAAILTVVASYVAMKVKSVYKEKVDTETKEKVVSTVVKAVEQLYKDVDGSVKLEKAKVSIVALLNEKGIKVTELEIDMLIESVVSEFNKDR